MHRSLGHCLICCQQGDGSHDGLRLLSRSDGVQDPLFKSQAPDSVNRRAPGPGLGPWNKPNSRMSCRALCPQKALYAAADLPLPSAGRLPSSPEPTWVRRRAKHSPAHATAGRRVRRRLGHVPHPEKAGRLACLLSSQ